jgi:hypothetical protein
LDGLFLASRARNLEGPFDQGDDRNLFKASLQDGFGSLTFGAVARARLSPERLVDDLTVAGMLEDGSSLGLVDLVYIPGIGGPLTVVYYDPATGEIAVAPPENTQLTSINLDSATGIFTNAPARNLGGSFDNDMDENIFKATFGSSFGQISFGNVAQPGLTEDFVLGDLSVHGSLTGGGDIGQIEIVLGRPPIVPEPSALLLMVLGLIGLLKWNRWEGTS